MFFKRFHLFIFRERVREGGREGEKRRCERETSVLCFLHMPRLWTHPTTQACALSRNQTGNLSLCRTMPNQLSHTTQGWLCPLTTPSPHFSNCLFPTDRNILHTCLRRCKGPLHEQGRSGALARGSLHQSLPLSSVFLLPRQPQVGEGSVWGCRGQHGGPTPLGAILRLLPEETFFPRGLTKSLWDT